MDVLPRARTPASEYFHSLLRSLPWPSVGAEEDKLVSVGFTSCLRREGVSTFAVHAAVAAASSGTHRVLLVDANLRNASLHKLLPVDRAPGFVDVMRDHCELEDAVQPAYCDLSVMGAGEIDAEPDAVYGATKRLHDLVAKLEDEFDLILFDLPPIGTSSVSLSLLGLLDGVILTVEAARVDWNVAARVRDRLHRAGIRLLGAALNHRRRRGPKWSP